MDTQQGTATYSLQHKTTESTMNSRRITYCEWIFVECWHDGMLSAKDSYTLQSEIYRDKMAIKLLKFHFKKNAAAGQDDVNNSLYSEVTVRAAVCVCVGWLNGEA